MFFLMLSALPRKINGSMAVCETVNGAGFLGARRSFQGAPRGVDKFRTISL